MKAQQYFGSRIVTKLIENIYVEVCNVELYTQESSVNDYIIVNININKDDINI